MARRKFLTSKDQGRLPFSPQGGFLAYATGLERRLLAGAFSGLILASLLYVYFVMSSVAHVAARGSLSERSAGLSAEVASLETRYLSRAQGITEPYARAHGFVSAGSRGVVERASLVTSR